jgi:hypothetical protein
MNKNFLIFLALVLVLVLAKITYSQYCQSKPEGCKKETFKDSYLTDDHMDN